MKSTSFAFVVYTYRKMKCNWVGKLEDIKQHLKGVGGCSVKVGCPNKYYDLTIERECGIYASTTKASCQSSEE